MSAVEFVSLAKSLMNNKGSPLAAANDPDLPLRVQQVLRAASTAGTLSNPTWAGELVSYQIIQTGFFEALRNIGVFDRLVGNGIRTVPEIGRIIVSTSVVTGTAVEEGRPKPITALSLASQDMEPQKATCIVVVSDEIASAAGSGGMGLISRELMNGVTLATDQVFLLSLASAETPIPSSGNDAAAIAADIAAMLASIQTGSTSKLFLVVPPAIANRLSTMVTPDGVALYDMTPSGGSLLGLSTLVSDGLGSDQVMLLDASRIAASPGNVVLDGSSQSNLIMDSNPAPEVAAALSLWQLNLKAIRAERWFSFAAIGTAVALLEPCAWGTTP